MTGKTEANCGLSLPVILKEIPPSNQIFAEIYGTHSHATTSFITQDENRAVELALTVVPV